MLETINKLNQVSQILFEVVPQKRLKKLADTIVIGPYGRAMKKLKKDESTDELAATIYDFVDKLSPQVITAIVFAAIAKLDSDQAQRLTNELKKLDMNDLKPILEKIVAIVERNAIPLGKIVKNVILIGDDVMKEFLSGISTSDDEADEVEEEEPEEEGAEHVVVLMGDLLGALFGVDTDDDDDDDGDDDDDDDDDGNDDDDDDDDGDDDNDVAVDDAAADVDAVVDDVTGDANAIDGDDVGDATAESNEPDDKEEPIK
ncbi:MAG: hypothetical protein IJX99_03545 [Clostridia bacterium]|nr:hypothetical protein [Clostridia bacterium]